MVKSDDLIYLLGTYMHWCFPLLYYIFVSLLWHLTKYSKFALKLSSDNGCHGQKFAGFETQYKHGQVYINGFKTQYKHGQVYINGFKTQYKHGQVYINGFKTQYNHGQVYIDSVKFAKRCFGLLTDE